MKQIYSTKMGMSDDASTAYFSLTQAQYSASSSFKHQILEGPLQASVRVYAGVDNVAGVKLPVFKSYNIKTDTENLGLAGGGKAIHKSRESFGVFLNALVRLASLQTSFFREGPSSEPSESRDISARPTGWPENPGSAVSIRTGASAFRRLIFS